MKGKSWIGVVLDGGLAKFEKYEGLKEIGEPIWEMAERVKMWLSNGHEVRIVTDRLGQGETSAQVVQAIEEWSEKHFGSRLEVTESIDKGMKELWGPQMVQVKKNTGVSVVRPGDREFRKSRGTR